MKKYIAQWAYGRMSNPILTDPAYAPNPDSVKVIYNRAPEEYVIFFFVSCRDSKRAKRYSLCLSFFAERIKREWLVKRQQASSGVDVPVVASGQILATSLYYVSGE